MVPMKHFWVQNIDACTRLHDMGQCISDEAVDEWRGRLLACVRANGGRFEQLL